MTLDEAKQFTGTDTREWGRILKHPDKAHGPYKRILDLCAEIGAEYALTLWNKGAVRLPDGTGWGSIDTSTAGITLPAGGATGYIPATAMEAVAEMLGDKKMTQRTRIFFKTT